MTEREILYKLRVIAHHENERILRRFLESQREAHLATSRAKEQAAKRAKDITEKEVKDEARLREQATDKRIREEERAQRAQERARKREEAEQQRHLDRLTAQWERAQDRILAGRMQMTEGFLGTMESIMRLSRGFAMLGLVGEENTKKLLETLVKVQAAFDVIAGGTKLWGELLKAVEGYRTAVSAAAAAEKIQRQASIAAISREIAAENALTAARLRSAGAAAASANARITAAGAGAAATGAEAVAGGMGAAGIGARVFGAGATVAAWAAAIAAVTADLWLLGEAVTGTAQRADSMTSSIAEWEVSTASFFMKKLPSSFLRGMQALSQSWDPGMRFIGSAAGLALSNRDVERFESDQRARIARQTRLELLAEAEAPGMFIGRRNQERLIDARLALGGPAAQRRQLILAAQRQAAISARETAGAIAAAGEGTPEAERRALLAEQARIAERQAKLAEQRLQVEKEILNEQRQVIRERITAATRELDLTRQRIKAEQDRLTSAAERFANLDPLQRSRAIAAMRQAQQRGAASLTREQRQLLASIGTRRAGRFARQSAIAEARRAGFFDVFGAEEQQNIRAGQQRERRLQVDVAFQRRLEVKIEMEEDRLAKATADFVTERLKTNLAALEAKLNAEIDRRVSEINQLRQSDVLQRSRLAGAR